MFLDQKIRRHTLDILARQPEHGYSIAQLIKSRAQGLLDQQESLLYPVLYELESQGIVESYMIREQNRTLRNYRLTEKGTKLKAKDEDVE
jgi:PadR family transcriptional regulator PadR